MNRKPKLIYLLVFSFFMCFMFVGYAKLTDMLDITGEIEGKPQKDVFITNISNETSNFTLDGFYSTILDQTITLDSNEEATYIVTLYNNNNTSKFIYEGYVCAGNKLISSGFIPSFIKNSFTNGLCVCIVL